MRCVQFQADLGGVNEALSTVLCVWVCSSPALVPNAYWNILARFSQTLKLLLELFKSVLLACDHGNLQKYVIIFAICKIPRSCVQLP